jgi:hypothetical protein
MTNEQFKMPADMKDISREELEIRLRQCMNDLRLTREEARENALKYMEMVGELGDRNVELQALKDGLEDAIRAKNAEMLLAEDVVDPSKNVLKDLLEGISAGLRDTAGVYGAGLQVEADEQCRLPLEGEKSIPLALETLCEGLLRCCHAGAVLSIKGLLGEDEAVNIELTLSQKGVDDRLLAETLRACEKPSDWSGLPGMLSLLTGWVLSIDAAKRGFRIRVPSH